MYDPVARDGRRGRARAAPAVARVQLDLVQHRARRPDPLDRRLHDRPDARGCGARAPTSGSSSRTRSSIPTLPDRALMAGVAAPDVATVLRRHRFVVRSEVAERRHVRLRRPQPLGEDGDAAHARGPRPVPRRGGRDLAAGRRAGPRGRGGRVAHRPADRDAGPAARAQPRVRCARVPRDGPGERLHDPPRRVPGREADRGEDDPGQRPAHASAATRSTRTASGRRRTSSSGTPTGSRCGPARSR